MRLAGFWIRLLADVIDALLLSALGWVTYLVSPGWVQGLGDNGALLGLLFGTLYTTALSSVAGDGQTLGKRLLKLQVRALDGRPLPVTKAMWRALIVAFSFYLGAFEATFTRLVPADAGVAVAKLLSVGWLVTVLGLILLTAFHPAKRGLHDLLSGSVVIHKTGGFDGAALAALNVWPTTRRWRWTLILLGLLLAGGVVGVLVATFRSRSPVELAQHQAWELLHRDPALRVANLKITTRKITRVKTGETTTTSAVVVMAKPPGLREPVRMDDPIIDQLFSATRANLPSNLVVDTLQVGVVTGFSLGIARRLTVTEFAEPYAAGGSRQYIARTTRY